MKIIHQRCPNLYIFLFTSMLFSLLNSCDFPPMLNKTSTELPTIDVTVTPTQAPKKKSTLIPKDPKPYFPPEEFVGYYTASFEVSSFVPCSEHDLPGSAKGYWIDIIQSSSFLEKYHSLLTEVAPNENQDVGKNTIVFAHFIGQLSNPLYDLYWATDRQGHMGLYKQEIIVIELLEMKILDKNQCAGS